MSEIIEARWLAEKITNKTIRGIALETSALVRAGLLPVGTRLPAIRDLAYEMGVSPATISEAWSELRQQKIVSGRGRNGTWVCADRFVAKPERLASAGHYGANVLDLSMAVPDQALLPPLAKAMLHATSVSDLNSYERSRIVPELRDALAGDWPYDAEAFLAINGGYNGVYTTIRALVRSGSVVAVEHPTAMRLLDILEDLGVKIVPVLSDEQGPVPTSLKHAMTERPAAFLFQPRLHSVTGQTVTPERIQALADVLANSDTLIIEDDGIADISAEKPVSLGSRFPDRTVRILSFSKTLGPDLRLAVLSGSKAIVEQIQSYRAFSAGWTSRVLQAAVAWLIRDKKTSEIVANARGIYQERRDALSRELLKRGVSTMPGSGLCLWVVIRHGIRTPQMG
ncbi:PLP-dependent aminotransferase family protein [Agrobacterium salinitolerans]|uniref:aminotransferase-like domain-containing protein n=1 Tax=Agrobacterium salinitolerans TaxID=1183413 RepID=UPI0022B86C64|nr:PLP-dependent aminotransferase family protein [Agrobacterium salinitolerans]MCZ7854732.1 PLP-dependent aminotransferase family protein [Agrobacterium salinitolerans]